jgi:hypothetical protein
MKKEGYRKVRSRAKKPEDYRVMAVRPWSLYSIGYLVIREGIQKKVLLYKHSCKMLDYSRLAIPKPAHFYQ